MDLDNFFDPDNLGDYFSGIKRKSENKKTKQIQYFIRGESKIVFDTKGGPLDLRYVYIYTDSKLISKTATTCFFTMKDFAKFIRLTNIALVDAFDQFSMWDLVDTYKILNHNIEMFNFVLDKNYLIINNQIVFVFNHQLKTIESPKNQKTTINSQLEQLHPAIRIRLYDFFVNRFNRFGSDINVFRDKLSSLIIENDSFYFVDNILLEIQKQFDPIPNDTILS